MTTKDWQRLARSPSQYAPKAIDVQTEREPIPVSPLKLTAMEQAIVADPLNDEWRWKWADGVDADHGKFIKAQMKIAMAIRQGQQPDPFDLELERQFLPRYRDEMLAKLSPWCARDLVFRRGAVERVSISARSFLSHGRALFQSIPLRGIRLTAIAWLHDELAKCEHLTWLERLDLTGCRLESHVISKIVDRPWPRRNDFAPVVPKLLLTHS